MHPPAVRQEITVTRTAAASPVNPDAGLAESWMKAEPATIEASATLTEASALMRLHNVRHLPVTEDNLVLRAVAGMCKYALNHPHQVTPPLDKSATVPALSSFWKAHRP